MVLCYLKTQQHARILTENLDNALRVINANGFVLLENPLGE